jgi:type VI secretion system protein VasJ
MLQRAESEILDFPYWLDLQRFGITALKSLGALYLGAFEAAKSECEIFLRRIPGIADLEFADGQAFADEETRSWITREIIPRVAQPEDRKEKSPTDPGAKDLVEQPLKWKSMAANGNLREALGIFQQELASLATGRSQFLARLELTKRCREAGQWRLALGQFELLNEASLRFSLDEWEPSLSREMLIEWLNTLRQFGRKAKPMAQDINSQVNQVYSRLCRLDLLAAFDAADAKLP